MQNGFDIRRIYQLTYIYLAIPLFIFFISWLDYAIAVCFTFIFAVSFYQLYKECSYSSELKLIPNNIVLAAIFVSLFWCFFAGIGYFYYQSFDYHFRNAVFRDLINYSWPVFYDKANTRLFITWAFGYYRLLRLSCLLLSVILMSPF